MSNQLKIEWIKIGYENFANSGFNGLKVELLSKHLKKSKSSFYHHFIDLENFILHLTKYHLERCVILQKKEQGCKNIDPELIEVLVEYKIDLLFNKQLRVNRDKYNFKTIIEESNLITGSTFIEIWSKDLDLNLREQQLQDAFSLVLENFFLQITFETLEYNWLSNYFSELKEKIKNLSS
ncbi:MAG: hypothetical protein SFU98_08765 [Leptospiraceae bacterium]|nr:hypothetical protein [Leptospiraceae bacterium]